jgi:hypothetical protein
MVSTVQTFSACAPDLRIFPKLHGLVDVPIAVTEICGLWISQMDTKAFGRATRNSCQKPIHELSSDIQSNCLRKIEKTIVCEHLFRAEAGDDDLVNLCHSS